MAILAIYSIKGGVGKTAAAVNLSYLAAHEGLSTLLCDLDPQGSATFYFRISPSRKWSAKRLIKGGEKLEAGIKATDYEFLDLLPADLSFRSLDIKLDGFKKPKDRLRRVLGPLQDEYQLIVLDCPPNITLESENIFRAADLIMVPLIPTVLSMESFRTLVDFFDRKGLGGKKLVPFLSLVDRRKSLHRETMERLLSEEPRMLRSFVPYASEVEKMGLTREPLPVSHAGSKAGHAFQGLWEEMRSRLRLEPRVRPAAPTPEHHVVS